MKIFYPVAHARGLAVREAIELRAIGERAQRRREEPAPPSLAPKKPDV